MQTASPELSAQVAFGLTKERLLPFSGCLYFYNLVEGPWESCDFRIFLYLVDFMRFIHHPRLPPPYREEMFQYSQNTGVPHCLSQTHFHCGDLKLGLAFRGNITFQQDHSITKPLPPWAFARHQQTNYSNL